MFREIIKKRLEEKNINLTRLGQITGIDKSTISCFLSGNRTISNKNLEKILGVLKLTLVPIPGFKYGYDDDNSDQNPPNVGEFED